MHFIPSLLTLAIAATMPTGPSAAMVHGHHAPEARAADPNADVVTVTLPASGSVHGALTVRRAQVAAYWRDEMGVDVDKLRGGVLGSQQSLPTTTPTPTTAEDGRRSYTFPEGSGVEGSGVEGTLSWDASAAACGGGSSSSNASAVRAVVPYHERMTCEQCWALCVIPLVGPFICSTRIPSLPPPPYLVHQTVQTTNLFPKQPSISN
ncbi:hypothetical protein GGR52DRAFT_293644 [Hypoxylon sp. FL1284]|nr:hypothetical protein GGR52DRAFT_293644 [Hypoxylon sp. FL1284]